MLFSLAIISAEGPERGIVMHEWKDQSAPPAGETKGQPFPPGTGGSRNFRIPALITLRDGSLFAAADARYETSIDGGGLDTIVSISKDGGESWRFSFPIYFGDSAGVAGTDATTVIDPAAVQGTDGAIYLLADVNPTGVTTCEWAGFRFPGAGTGYVAIDGVQRLALTADYGRTDENPAENGEDAYPYYAGDFGEEGYAPVLRRRDHAPSGYALDRMYNLYAVREGGVAPLTQKQVDGGRTVAQNVFYRDSALHVYNTGYMWLAISKDGGASWRHTILNPQIKRPGETGLLVSPGRGTVIGDGTVVIPFYHFSKEGLCASFIYKKAGEDGWGRSPDLSVPSSESEIVELADGRLRMFYRSRTGFLCYADAFRQEGGYRWGEAVRTGMRVHSDCNLSAIACSRRSRDGRQVILLSCPSGEEARRDGRIFTFLADADGSMELADTFPVNRGIFQYSCLTEQKDGKIALLYEDGEASITFASFEAAQVAPSVFGEGDGRAQVKPDGKNP